MFVGSGTLCLRVQDLERSIRFYEALGLKVVPDRGVAGTSAQMSRGSFKIFLMQNFGRDSINFRGADAFDVEARLREQGHSLGTQPNRQRDGGSNWMIEDPDGHGLFFNTHQFETTPQARQAMVAERLQDAAQDLMDLGASRELLTAIREVAQKFGPAID